MLGSPLGSALFLGMIGRMQWAYPHLLARLYGDPNRIPPGTLEGYTAPVRLPRSEADAFQVLIRVVIVLAIVVVIVLLAKAI